MLTEFGIEPFYLIGYRGRKLVEIRHARDEMDEKLLDHELSLLTTEEEIIIYEEEEEEI